MLESKSQVNIFAFADDLKLLSTNPGVLQDALNKVIIWSKQWQLRFQLQKSEQIYFTPSKYTAQQVHRFAINGEQLNLVNTVRDLGIFLTSDLKWSAQVTNIYNKAIRLVYNVLRSFKSNHLNLYTLIFKTYIRPIIEYNSGIWSPYLITEIRKIESIQKTYTRLVCKKLNISYNN